MQADFIQSDYFANVGPHCPPGYQHLGRVSDGRTCIGNNLLDEVDETDSSNFNDGSCSSGYDRIRERWTPKTADEISRFRKYFPYVIEIRDYLYNVIYFHIISYPYI